jgi:hypothetical protein
MHSVESELHFEGFEDDEDIHAQLWDLRIDEDLTFAKLSYGFRYITTEEPRCEADFSLFKL